MYSHFKYFSNYCFDNQLASFPGHSIERLTEQITFSVEILLFSMLHKDIMTCDLQ